MHCIKIKVRLNKGQKYRGNLTLIFDKMLVNSNVNCGMKSLGSKNLCKYWFVWLEWLRQKNLLCSRNLFGTSLWSKPKLGSAQLGFGSSFLEKKLGLARLAMPSKKLGSVRLAISCKKSSVQLSLLYHLKSQVTLKDKKWTDF